MKTSLLQKIKTNKKTLAVSAIVFSLLATVSSFALAGSLSPSASPASTSYTLSDIYTRLTTNTSSTEANHLLSVLTSPAATMHTLTEIYEAIPTILPETVKLGTTYLGIAGTLTPDGGTSTTADVFNGKTANLTNDWTLDTGTLNLACNTETFDGTANKVSDAYDGNGNGTNRYCTTDSGNAVSSDILSGKTAWVDGLAINGSGTIYAYGDASASKVLITATSSGTALANLYNGSNTAGTFPGGTQSDGGVDDLNNYGAPATGRYEKGWTQCAVGNNWCGTNSTRADARDDSTGLVWSLPCNGVGCTSFSDTSPITYTWDSSGANNDSKTASQFCSAVSWNLPHQKQLMQAYIDGSYGNLETAGVRRNHWSATTVSSTTATAWRTNLSNGTTYNYAKTNSAYVRCVVFSPGN